MAWIPYIENDPIFPLQENEIAVRSEQTVIMNAILLQLRLLNDRFEETFGTGINEEDIE